jgi:hypothetical protein
LPHYPNNTQIPEDDRRARGQWRVLTERTYQAGEGAHFSVGGEARRMAKDVDAALRKIIQDQSSQTEEQTNEYVEKLKADRRYKRDAY